MHLVDGDDPRATAEVCLYTTSTRGRPLSLTRTADGNYVLRGSRRGDVIVSTRYTAMQLWPDYCAEADSDPADSAVPVEIEDETTDPMPRIVAGEIPESIVRHH